MFARLACKLLLICGLLLAMAGQPTVAQGPGRLHLPEPGTTDLRVLTTADAADRQLVLTAAIDGTVRMAPDRAEAGQFWVLSPVGRRTYRLQLFDAGQLWSLAARGPAEGVALLPSARDARQLWRIVPSLTLDGAARLESVAYPSRSLAGGRDSLVVLERSSGGPAQSWLLRTDPPPPALALPTVRLAEHDIRPAPPLAPVTARLANSHENELWVVVADLRTAAERRYKIPPGGAVDVQLDRDAGGTLVENYEVHSPRGEFYREQYVTAVPPARLYDITVYERFLQSIAIDRTGTSPNRVEDINYQPRSVGIIPVPPGDRFSGGTIDVYRAAKAADNPGAVRGIDPEAWQQPQQQADPLRQALEEATR